MLYQLSYVREAFYLSRIVTIEWWTETLRLPLVSDPKRVACKGKRAGRSPWRVPQPAVH